MARMKEIFTDVEEIMEYVNSRLEGKSAAYAILLTGALVKSFQQEQSKITTKWLEEEVKND